MRVPLLRLLITQAWVVAVVVASSGAVRSTEAAPRVHSTGSGPPIPTRTSTPARFGPTATPTRPSSTPTSTPTLKPSATPTATPTAVAPWPTLPGFSLLTSTPIVDVFDFPPGDLTGPIPTPTLGQIAAPQPVPDLIAYDIEITQGMQSLGNHMPLVAGRLTYVRIYVRTDGADYLDVKALLQGSRDGQVLGVIPADNQPITAHGDGGDRLDVDDSLYFGLPWSWFDEGTLHLNAFVYAGHPDAPFDHEPESFNNFIQTTVEFESGAGINLSFVPIHLHENYSAAQPEKLFLQSEPGFWTVVIGMLRHLPFPGFNLYPPPVDAIYCGGGAEAGVFDGPLPIGQHGNCDFNLQVSGGAQYVTVMMALVDAFTDDPTEDLNYYGMVHPDFASQMMFFNDLGDSISYGGLALNEQAYGEMSSAPNGTVPWFIGGAGTLAHELGHRLGLDHVDCAGTEEAGGAIDEDYPWPAPDCSIANVDEEGFYGFDVWYQVLPGVNQPTVISNDPGEAAPNQGFPLMGYQWPQYADAYQWCTILQTIGVTCNPATTPLQASAASPHLARPSDPGLAGSRLLEALQHQFSQPQPAPFLVVSGSVQKVPVVASIDLAITLPEPPADLNAHPAASVVATDFEVALLDAGGSVLASRQVVETTVNHGALNVIPFLIGLPFEPDAAQLVIRHQGTVVAARQFSANPPTVAVLAPVGGEVFTAPFEIRWQAADPDGDTLNYTLQYSPDGGQTWQALAFGLTDDSFQVLSLYNLTGSDQAKVRVLASDGAWTTTAESAGTFSVPNTPPLPVIQSPGHLAVFPLGGRVPMRGSATDREDGEVPSASLTWESSLDGFLATGDRLEPDGLSPGNHVITLTAADSHGQIARAQVGILVDERSRRQLPGDDELSLASRILAAGPAWEGAGGRPPMASVALLVVLGVGGLVALLLMVPLLRSWLRR